MKPQTILAALFAVATLQGADPIREGGAPRLGSEEVERQIEAHLAAYEKGGDYDRLVKAHWLQRSLTAETAQDADRQFELELRLLSKCLEARDPAYDVKNPVRGYTKVSPPLWTRQPVVAGMDPKEVKDPAAREKYEADIAANNKIVEKSRRELSLQRAADECEFRVRGHLQEARRMVERRDRSIASIRRLVKNEAMRDTLVKFALSPPAAAQP